MIVDVDFRMDLSGWEDEENIPIYVGEHEGEPIVNSLLAVTWAALCQFHMYFWESMDIYNYAQPIPQWTSRGLITIDILEFKCKEPRTSVATAILVASLVLSALS